MEDFDWNALIGLGTVGALVVAIWAVIVAHIANGRADESNKIAATANEIAIAALPRPTPVLEVGLVPDKQNTWQIVNVGTATLHNAQVVHFRGGEIPDLKDMLNTFGPLPPGGALEFEMYAFRGEVPTLYVTGWEHREGQMIQRSAKLFLD